MRALSIAVMGMHNREQSRNCWKRGLHGSVIYITKFVSAWPAGNHCRSHLRSCDCFRVYGWMVVAAQADATENSRGIGASGWTRVGSSTQPRQRDLLHWNIRGER